MMDRKWTQGPWVIGHGPDFGRIMANGKTLVEEVNATIHDARLMVAADDLYDALQAMVDYCNAECGSKIYPGHQANQALAKARGETQ